MAGFDPLAFSSYVQQPAWPFVLWVSALSRRLLTSSSATWRFQGKCTCKALDSLHFPSYLFSKIDGFQGNISQLSRRAEAGYIDSSLLNNFLTASYGCDSSRRGPSVEALQRFFDFRHACQILSLLGVFAPK